MLKCFAVALQHAANAFDFDDVCADSGNHGVALTLNCLIQTISGTKLIQPPGMSQCLQHQVFGFKLSELTDAAGVFTKGR